MDDTDVKILKAINTLSPKSFIDPIKVNEILKLDEVDLGNRLMLLKKSGYVDVMTSEYVSSGTLPNFISKLMLTDLGRKALEE